MPPSPNLKTMRAVYLYASTCYFEGSVVSLGRGTEHPFEMYGSPDMRLFSYKFVPRSMPGALHPDYEGQECSGVDLTSLTYEEIWRNGINLNYIVNAYSMLMSLPGADRERGLLPDGRPFFGRNPFIDKLIGNSWVREKIIDGCSPEDIKSMWKDDVERFKSLRRKYLLYNE